MKPAARQSGNLMIDLIVGILLLAIISISAGGVLSNLFQRSADAYERVQSTWLANSVMEYYSGKEFANIEADNINDEKFTPDPRLVANVTVDWVTINDELIAGSDEETSFKKIIVNANNNVSDNSVTLKTIISAGGGESGAESGCGGNGWIDCQTGTDVLFVGAKNGTFEITNITFTGATACEYAVSVDDPTDDDDCSGILNCKTATLLRDGVAVATHNYNWQETIQAENWGQGQGHTFSFDGYMNITIHKETDGDRNLYSLELFFNGCHILVVE